ncbi:MAG TPA: AMP-binding protein [Candidatus Acidoferrales bacterium]|nr:AMP-binding protein [Candidatus Acidoferrales bacterium]
MSGIGEFIAARDLLRNATSYASAKSEFSWPHIDRFNWALDYFDTLAENCSHPAILYVDDKGAELKVSFRTLKERSNRAANFLKGLGLRKGDRVLLMMPSSIELFEIFLGAMKLGCVIIPASTLLTESDIVDRIARGKTRAIFSSPELTSKVDKATKDESVTKVVVSGKVSGWLSFEDADTESPDFQSSDTFRLTDELLIYFTSGTTAKPKLVLHTHGSYPVGHLTTMYWIGVKKGELHYNISAPGWAKYAYSSIFGAWNAEATTFLYNYSGRFDAKSVLDMVERYEVRTLCAPPTVWRFLLLENLKARRFALRELVSAGEPLNPEIIERVRSGTDLSIREGFGQTETTLQVGFFPGMQIKPGSMGLEAPGFQVSVLDEEQRLSPVKQDGALAIRVRPERPIGLMEGYIDPRERNAEVFVGDWYLTGDLAYRDEEGYFWFIGRADDVFKSSDYRISAFEVESELMAHPAVAEVAVVASPDLLRGYVPKAYVALRPNLQPTRELAFDIFKFTRERMAPYKRPRMIQFVRELPKTASGKIRRIDLRASETNQREKESRTPDEYLESDFKNELVSELKTSTSNKK